MEKKDNRKTRICPQCGKIHFSTNYLCPKHSNQMRNFGKFLDSNPRTVYDPNEIRVHGDYSEVDTYDKQANVQNTFIIDTEDIPLISKYKWGTKYYKKDNMWYVACIDNTTHKHIYLHHLLMGFPAETIDHIDGNTLNNRKSNLRIANKNIQSINCKKTEATATGIKGVKQSNRGYVAHLGWEGKTYYSKIFKTVEEASYFRYLLTQMCSVPVRDTDMSWQNSLSKEQIDSINTYFLNRFKNRV